MASANQRDIAASFASGLTPRERADSSSDARVDAAQSRPRIAYLTNLYPAISHSFIRTEIEAIERLGFAVQRFTIRRGRAGAQGEDADEVARTTVLLDGSRIALTGAVANRLMRRPAGTLRAARDALRLACRGSFQAKHLVRGIAYFVEAAALADALDRAGVRHVHVHFGTNPATVARLARRMAALSFSFTAHGPDEFDAPQALDLAGKIAEAAFVIGVSSFGRSQLMRWSDPAHWNRIHVVRCAVAPAFLSAQPDPGTAPRSFVAVARLSPQKGLPLLIEAASLLAGNRQFTVDVIGDGDQRAAITARIAEMRLGAHIRLLGWQSPDAVRRAMASARALVLPSFAEGLPVVLMEALALGRPAIATAVAGIFELIDAETGWLVPAGSAEALAGAMRDVLDASPDRLRAMGAAGRERVAAMHDPDTNARRLAELLAPWV